MVIRDVLTIGQPSLPGGTDAFALHQHSSSSVQNGAHITVMPRLLLCLLPEPYNLKTRSNPTEQQQQQKKLEQ